MSKLLVLVIVFAACQGELGGSDGDRGYAISRDDIEFVHEVGVTACPQDLGDVEVTNLTDAVFIFTVSVTASGGTDVIDFGDADDDGPTSLDAVEFEVDVGDSVVFVPWFNCQTEVEVDSILRIEPEDGGLPFSTLGVSGTFE